MCMGGGWFRRCPLVMSLLLVSPPPIPPRPITVVLISKLCPPGIEATVYALLAGFTNFGVAVASSLGALAMDVAGIRTPGPGGGVCNFDRLPLLIAVGHVGLPLLVLPLTFVLIPSARMTDDLLDGRGLPTTADDEDGGGGAKTAGADGKEGGGALTGRAPAYRWRMGRAQGRLGQQRERGPHRLGTAPSRRRRGVSRPLIPRRQQPGKGRRCPLRPSRPLPGCRVGRRRRCSCGNRRGVRGAAASGGAWREGGGGDGSSGRSDGGRASGRHRRGVAARTPAASAGTSRHGFPSGDVRTPWLPALDGPCLAFTML